MYIESTRQAVPTQEYRELLGIALFVFNANNAFIIENILHTNSVDYNWYELIDKESGKLLKAVEATIKLQTTNEVYQLFSEIIEMRNRIIHSFAITDTDGEAKLATKTKVKEDNKQFVITKEYLIDFIKKNEALNLMLDEYRNNIGVAV